MKARRNPAPLQGVELIRHAATLADLQREAFNDRFTAHGLLRLAAIHAQCGWDFLPEAWTARQLREALMHDMVPQWDDDARPVYIKRPR